MLVDMISVRHAGRRAHKVLRVPPSKGFPDHANNWLIPMVGSCCSNQTKRWKKKLHSSPKVGAALNIQPMGAKGMNIAAGCYHPENSGSTASSNLLFYYSMDWFKGKSTGNHGFYHEI